MIKKFTKRQLLDQCGFTAEETKIILDYNPLWAGKPTVLTVISLKYFSTVGHMGIYACGDHVKLKLSQ